MGTLNPTHSLTHSLTHWPFWLYIWQWCSFIEVRCRWRKRDDDDDDDDDDDVAGYRSVQLLNEYSEELEIASLLVRITLSNPKVTTDAVVKRQHGIVISVTFLLMCTIFYTILVMCIIIIIIIIIISDSCLLYIVNHRSPCVWGNSVINQTAVCNEKKHSERCKHCVLAVVRWIQKYSPCCRPPSWGCRTTKI